MCLSDLSDSSDQTLDSFDIYAFAMDEEALEASIDTYQQQLDQVTQAIQAAGSTPDLENLKQDLEELINLTKESLLSLKKGALLKQLDEVDQCADQDVSTSGLAGSNSANEMDDEYAAFQAMLGDDITNNSTDKNGDRDADDFNKTMSELYADIVGTRCRAPFVQSWGEKRFGNALIVGIDDASTHDEIPKVRVMFCNPTHQSMLPCKYFLDGDCKFTEENCRCSHGYQVALEELQEYMEPDYSCLKMESKCLARYEDDLWYNATVVDIEEDNVTVMFDSYEDEAVQVAAEDILPLDPSENHEESEDENEPITGQDEEEEEESLPVFLWKPPSHGLGDLGQWEAHTRGIGSKLLTKMGYEPGKGLGKIGEGRILPVPIHLLPQGKSLDKIMKLKELAGDRDMFDAMKKLEKRMKKQAEKMEKAAERKEKPNVFDFINHKLRGKKGNLSELFHKHESRSHKGKGQGHSGNTISEHDLHKKSEKSINIQLFKTAEEMKSVEKELDRLRQSLARNENRDRNVAAQVRSKIQSLETYRDKLQSSEQTIQNHQKKRSDHRKLTVF